MILSQKKNKKIAWLIAINLSTLLVLMPVIFLLTRHTYDAQGANIKNFNTSELLQNTKDINLYEQTFYARNPQLNSILFYLKNENYHNDVELSIIDQDTQTIVRHETVRILSDDNMQIFIWDFENISQSQDKKYSFFIMPNKKGFSLLGTSSDLYESGELFINSDKQQDLILAFSFDYYSDNLFSILNKRLGIYKTGLFAQAWSYYLLYLLCVILIGYISYHLSLVIIRDN